MNASAVWQALRRLWQRPREDVAQKTADNTEIMNGAAVVRALERLGRSGSILALQSDDGTFDHAARLVACGSKGMTLKLQSSQGEASVRVPPALNATACTESGVLLFSLRGLKPAAEGLLHAPCPPQLVQVQSRRHFRITGLNGQHFQANLLLPGQGRVPRLRNLSEEGVAFDKAGPGVPHGTLIRDAKLELDGVQLDVPLMQVMYCRDLGDYCAVGAHFEILVADEARLLRRWIAAAQATMLALHAPK